MSDYRMDRRRLRRRGARDPRTRTGTALGLRQVRAACCAGRQL